MAGVSVEYVALQVSEAKSMAKSTAHIQELAVVAPKAVAPKAVAPKALLPQDAVFEQATSKPVSLTFRIVAADTSSRDQIKQQVEEELANSASAAAQLNVGNISSSSTLVSKGYTPGVGVKPVDVTPPTLASPPSLTSPAPSAPIGLYVGVSVGVAVCFIGILALLYWWYRHRAHGSLSDELLRTSEYKTSVVI